MENTLFSGFFFIYGNLYIWKHPYFLYIWTALYINSDTIERDFIVDILNVICFIYEVQFVYGSSHSSVIVIVSLVERERERERDRERESNVENRYIKKCIYKGFHI